MEKILVLVKEVLSLERGFTVDNGQIDDKYINRELNEWDKYALEEALQISDERDNVEVVTVTVGPFFAVDTINLGLAMGADRAIRVWDDSLNDVPSGDPWPVARILSRVVEREEPDLVLAGAQSDDDSNGSIGIMVAETSGYNWIAVVDDIECEEDSVRVRRELEGGRMESSRAQLPALLTVQTGINEPRYVSMRMLRRQSGDDQITSLSLDDLGLDRNSTASDLNLLKLQVPKQSVETTYLEGEPNEEAGQLIDVLQTRGVME